MPVVFAQPSSHLRAQFKAGKRRRAPYHRQFPQVRTGQRAPVHVATVPQVMRNLPAGLPDDAQRQIAEQQVAESNEMLLPAAAKAEIRQVVAKQHKFNSQEIERGRPNPAKLATLYSQVENSANHDPLSHELHKMRDEISTNPALRAAIKDYLESEVRRQRFERRPCRGD